MKHLIQVTAEDIQEGERENCLYCPVALALHRAIPQGLFMNTSYVGSTYARINGKQYPLPQIAIDAIADFDNGRFIGPFSFELEIN